MHILSQNDYNQFQAKQVTAQQLSERYLISLASVYKQIKDMVPNHAINYRRTWSENKREELKQALLDCTPYDKINGVSSVLKQYEIKTLTQALQICRVKSLSELRTGSKHLHQVLTRLKLKLNHNVLYSPAFRGVYHRERQIHLTDDELAALHAQPVVWIKENATRIRETCLSKAPKTRHKPQTIPALGTRLQNRYTRLKTTIQELRSGHTRDELTYPAYSREARSLIQTEYWERGAFTDEELTALGLKPSEEN